MIKKNEKCREKGTKSEMGRCMCEKTVQINKITLRLNKQQKMVEKYNKTRYTIGGEGNRTEEKPKQNILSKVFIRVNNKK